MKINWRWKGKKMTKREKKIALTCFLTGLTVGVAAIATLEIFCLVILPYLFRSGLTKI